MVVQTKWKTIHRRKAGGKIHAFKNKRVQTEEILFKINHKNKTAQMIWKLKYKIKLETKDKI